MAETDMCDNVIVINKGKIIAEGTPCYLKNKFSYYILKIVYKTESLKEKLNKKKIKYKLDRNVINIRLNNSKEGMKIINEFEDDIDNFEIIAGNMDDVFLNITEDKKRVII